MSAYVGTVDASALELFAARPASKLTPRAFASLNPVVSQEKYAEPLRTSPLVLHRLKSSGRWPVHFSKYTVVCTLDELAAGSWDYVLVTLASSALRKDGFLRSFVPRLCGNPVVVMLTPGFSDRSVAIGL